MQHLCKGATLMCTGGTDSSQLDVSPSQSLSIDNKPVATAADHISMINIQPFGNCTLMDPTSPKPCIPATPSLWNSPNSTIKIDYQMALTFGCYLQCSIGGSIQCVDPGQVNVIGGNITSVLVEHGYSGDSSESNGDDGSQSTKSKYSSHRASTESLIPAKQVIKDRGESRESEFVKHQKMEVPKFELNERQETTKELAACQSLERRDELTVTPEDEVEIKTESVSLLETLGIFEDVKSTLRTGHILLVGENHSKTHGRELCLEIMETGLVSSVCLEFDSELLSLDSDSIDELEEVMNIIEMTENSPMGHHCPISMQQIKKKALECNVKIKLVDNQSYKGDKRQRFLAKSIKMVLSRHSESDKGLLVLIGSDHLKDISEQSRHSWRSLQYHIHSEFLPNYKIVQYGSGLVYIQV